MAISLIALVGVVVVVLLPIWVLNVLTDRKWPGAVWLLFLCILIATYVSIVSAEIANSPDPIPIDDKIESGGADDRIKVTRIRIGFLSEGEAALSVDVINRTTQEILLLGSSDADAGSVAGFSPGSTRSTWGAKISPEWEGTLHQEFPVPNFLRNGCINISLERPADATEELSVGGLKFVHSERYFPVPGE